MKWFCEIVKDFDGTYCANMTNENGMVRGLPENVNYKTLCNGIRATTGISLVPCKYLKFKQHGEKKYAYVQNCFESLEGCCMTYTPENMCKVKAALAH